MRFEEKKNWVMWQNTAVGLLTDFGVSIVICYVGRVVRYVLTDSGISFPIVNEFDDLGLGWVLVVFVGLQIMKVLVWARGRVAEIFIYRWYLAEYIVDLMLDGITKAELPDPGGRASSQNYFDSIVVDDTLDCQKRIEAAYWLGVLQFPFSWGRFWDGVELEFKMVAALDRYEDRCREK